MTILWLVISRADNVDAKGNIAEVECYDLAMRSIPVTVLVLIALISLPALAQTSAQVTTTTPASTVTPQTSPDPAADALAQRAIDIIGGPEWQRARYLSFTFNTERSGQVKDSFVEEWDRVTGGFRVSGKDPAGVPFLIIESVKTKSGRAWQNGVEVTDQAAAQNLLALGYRRFVNDTYWLLMPLAMFDSGVKRSAVGQRTDACGRAWDVVRLTYDTSVGIANDVAWAWINHESGVVEEWDMKLLGTPADQPPIEVFFRDFHRVNGLLIAARREIKGKNQAVRFDDLKILPEVPTGAFALP
jgi:hypothetical protein